MEAAASSRHAPQLHDPTMCDFRHRCFAASADIHTAGQRDPFVTTRARRAAGATRSR